MHTPRQDTGVQARRCGCRETMSTEHGNLNRRTALKWVGRIMAASATAVWWPGSVARAATAKASVKRTVVLDPGHGGLDPGAIGVTGAYEKEITLSTVALAAGLLEATRRYKVVLTRRDDEFIALEDRVSRARA